VTMPAASSPCDGVYTAFKVFALGTNVPCAPDQDPPLATVTLPFNWIEALFAQRTPSMPALAVGDAVKVISTWSVTGTQKPFPIVVRVSVRFPAAISDGVGV